MSTLEIGNGAWHCEVVQFAEGIRVYSAAGGRRKEMFLSTSLQSAGLSSLNEGQIVEYDEVTNKGKTAAENLKIQR